MPEDKAKVTIYDVATKAGVAISTVSRVLNASPDVSDETRARVKRAIELLNFSPDRVARALAQQKVQTIALAIPTFTTPFHNELLKGIRNCIHDEDTDLLLCDLGSTDRHVKLLSFLHRGAVSGLLLAGVKVTDRIATELRTMNAPVVVIGYHHTNFDSYSWDDAHGARLAVDHLTANGHKRIGLIRSASQSNTQNERIAGYRRALEAAGIQYDDSLVVSGETPKHAGYSEESGFEAMKRLLALDTPVTAVFASSDAQAIGALQAIREAGLSVPNDIAVVGYDDVKTSRFVGLSSVDQHMLSVGEKAAARLMQRVSGTLQAPPESFLEKPELKIRSSSQIILPNTSSA